MRIIRVSSPGTSWVYLLDINGKILEAADEIRDAKRVDGWIEQIKPRRSHGLTRKQFLMRKYS